MPAFYKDLHIEERDEWIRLLNKLRQLMMEVMLTFFEIALWNIHL